MSLTTHSSNPNVQQIFAFQLNPVFDKFNGAAKQGDVNVMLTQQSILQELIKVINLEDPNMDFSKFIDALSSRINECIANRSPLHEPPKPLANLTTSLNAPLDAPRGMHNLGANCGVNAYFQVIAHSTSMRKRILESKDTKIAPIRDILNAYLQGKKVNSQYLRLAFADLVEEDDVEKISTSAGIQLDPIKLYQILANYLGVRLSFDQQQEFRGSAETVAMDLKPETTTQIDLDMSPSNKKISFSQLLEGFFIKPLDDGRSGYRLRKLQPTQDELMMQANRFYQFRNNTPVKIQTKIEAVPEHLTIPAKYMIDNTNALYDLVGCIIHIGKTIASGHYVSLIKTGKTFFYINDESVFEWDSKNAKWTLVEGDDRHNPIRHPSLGKTPQAMMAQGYLFQYRKMAVPTKPTPLAGRANKTNVLMSFVRAFFKLFE